MADLPEVERRRRRRARLVTELDDEQVQLLPRREADGRVHLGRQLFSYDALHEVLVDELAYARTPPVHETRRNSYGALVNPGGEQAVAALTDIGTLIGLTGDDPSKRDLDAVRAYANLDISRGH